MALVTYVLIVGYVLGQMKQFTPEQLGVRYLVLEPSIFPRRPWPLALGPLLLAPCSWRRLLRPQLITCMSPVPCTRARALQGTLSSTFGWLVAELLGYRTAFYILSIPWRSTYELVAYCGYKYCSMTAVLLLALVSGGSLMVYYSAVAVCAAGLCFYLFFAMMGSVPPEAEGQAVKVRPSHWPWPWPPCIPKAPPRTGPTPHRQLLPPRCICYRRDAGSPSW